MNDDTLGFDAAGLVGPDFYKRHGANQIPITAVLIVITIDGEEGGNRSTYVCQDTDTELATHYGLVDLAHRIFDTRMADAVNIMQGVVLDDEEDG